MTAKQALKLLGWPLDHKHYLKLWHYARDGKIKASTFGRLYNYEKQGLLDLKEKLEKIPKATYQAGEIAEILGVSNMHVRRLVRQGKLTAFRHPGSRYHLFPKMKALEEIEKLKK